MTDGANYKRSYYGTISYIPAIFGLYAAAEVIHFLTEKDEWFQTSEGGEIET